MDRRRRPAAHRQKRYRRRKRYRIDYLRLILSICAAALLVVLVSGALTSPRFQASNIEVEGVRTVKPRDVVRLAALNPTTNIFLLPKDEIRKRVEINPVVMKAEIHRKLPDTVVVKVTERQPFTILNTGGLLYQVDSLGIPFRVVPKADHGVPVISCTLPCKPVIGKAILLPVFTSAMETIRLARTNGIVGLSKITVDQYSELCLNVGDRFQVKLGRPERLPEKIRYAATVIKRKGEIGNNIEYIDGSCPEAFVIKLRDGAGSSKR